MGKAVFVLDHPGYQRYAAVLLKTDRRTRLEKRLTKTHHEYRSHLQREGTLAAEISSVTRELARKPDPDLTARMGTLLAVRELWPELLQECARAYAESLAQWVQVTWREFDEVFKEHEAAIDATSPDAVNLVWRQNSLRRNDDPQHATITAELAAIGERNRPHVESRDIAHMGRGTVSAFASMVLGHTARCEYSPNQIAAFVNRHANRKVAA